MPALAIAGAVNDAEATAFKRSKMTLLSLGRMAEAEWRKLTNEQRAWAIESLHAGRQVAVALGLRDEEAIHSIAIRALEALADAGDPE